MRDAQGRYDPYSGASFVMAAAFDERGRSRGRALLSYSQSDNPRSRHYADQTRRFSAKRWVPMRFTERQIRRDRSTGDGWYAGGGERRIAWGRCSRSPFPTS